MVDEDQANGDRSNNKADDCNEFVECILLSISSSRQSLYRRCDARLGTPSESNFTEYQWASALAAADRKAAKKPVKEDSKPGRDIGCH
jgi:hypothetical protein